jgi:hypothetical protein
MVMEKASHVVQAFAKAAFMEMGMESCSLTQILGC